MENSLYFITAYAILGQVVKIRIFFLYYKCWICIVESLQKKLKDKICTIGIISTEILNSCDYAILGH